MNILPPFRQCILNRLKHERFATQIHAWFRLSSFPFTAVLNHLPNQNHKHIVDFGSGFGLFSFLLAEAFPHSRIITYDPAATKAKVAKRLLNGFAKVKVINSLRQHRLKSLDTIVLLDVLYLLPKENKLQLLRQLFATLKPNGQLHLSIVPKEVSWRYLLAWIQEWVMVKLLKRTSSASNYFEFETEIWVNTALRRCGFVAVKTHHLFTPFPFFHKHILFIATKPF